MSINNDKFTEIINLGHSVLYEANNHEGLMKMYFVPKGSISVHDYQQQCYHYLSIIQALKPQCLLIDSRDLNYTISLEMQEWYDKEIGIFEAQILKKQAVLMPRGFIEAMVVELALKQQQINIIETQIFLNEEEAFRWLIP